MNEKAKHAKTKDIKEISKIARNKPCVILDSRGSEEDGFEYLIEVRKLRIWTNAKNVTLRQPPPPILQIGRGLPLSSSANE